MQSLIGPRQDRLSRQAAGAAEADAAWKAEGLLWRWHIAAVDKANGRAAAAIRAVLVRPLARTG